MKQYSFPRKRGTMPSTRDILKDDLSIISSISDGRQREKLETSLREGLGTGSLSGYIGLVTEDFSSRVQSGNLVQSQLENIANSVQKSVSEFWGVSLNMPIEILPAGKMLEAEITAGEQLMKAIGRTSPNPTSPSPSFIDHLAQKIVLSDRYVFTYPDSGTGFYAWEEGIFRTIVAAEAGKSAIRVLRGEAGSDYVQMLKSIPEFTVAGLQHTVAAANNYGNARILKDVGVPLLYRRLLDIFYSNVDEVQIVNMTMKTLSEEIGIRIATLFDLAHAIPGSGFVTGALLGSHPNYERKDAAITRAVQTLSYPVQTSTIGRAGPLISLN